MEQFICRHKGGGQAKTVGTAPPRLQHKTTTIHLKTISLLQELRAMRLALCAPKQRR